MIEIIISNSTIIDPIFLSKTLSREKTLELKPSIINGLSFQAELTTKPYDVALILPMETTNEVIDTLDSLSEHLVNTKKLVVINHCQPNYIELLKSKGVHGILKSESLKEKLVDAISQVNEGKIYLDSTICDKGKESDQSSYGAISEREKEIIGFIASGFTSKQIADKLCISEHTIKSHRKNINQKLQVHSPAQLVKYAIENKLGV